MIAPHKEEKRFNPLIRKIIMDKTALITATKKDALIREKGFKVCDYHE